MMRRDQRADWHLGVCTTGLSMVSLHCKAIKVHISFLPIEFWEVDHIFISCLVSVPLSPGCSIPAAVTFSNTFWNSYVCYPGSQHLTSGASIDPSWVTPVIPHLCSWLLLRSLFGFINHTPILCHKRESGHTVVHLFRVCFSTATFLMLVSVAVWIGREPPKSLSADSFLLNSFFFSVSLSSYMLLYAARRNQEALSTSPKPF